MNTADLLLHPIRLRIVEAFLGDRELTTTQLRNELSDVPAASLYRHIARLVGGGVLVVSSERRVRGAVERTYVLTPASDVSPREAARMSRDDLRRGMLAYVAALMADFDGYLGRDEIDVLKDGVGCRMVALWLDDREFAHLVADINQAVLPALANGPGPRRRRRILRTVVLPGSESEAL